MGRRCNTDDTHRTEVLKERVEAIDNTVRLLASAVSRQSTVILCFYTGALPIGCAPMPRIPSPPAGLPFDQRFASLLEDATKLNSAIHDGAVMIGRTTPDAPYLISGWSFRLFAASPTEFVEANRGSAFNSCVAMSTMARVDALYLISKAGVERCSHGTSVLV
jgi:hypothetical protein